MSRVRMQLLTGAAILLAGARADAACCYFSAKNVDILQPSQKVFIAWNPETRLESFTVQPRFEGNAMDFGMVIPTPSQPKLHEMPRDFFKHLAVCTILKKREFARSRLLPAPRRGLPGSSKVKALKGLENIQTTSRVRPPVVVLETGVVGSLDYKIIAADRADDLFGWIKDNKYHYAGDEATLNHYIQKKWLFTVMKIDTMQMKKNKDGSFLGEVTPTRFQFSSEELVYPLKITQISVKDRTEALFYVQAPQKMDLPGDMSYQYNWVPMLQAASGCTPGGLPGRSADWLKAIDDQIPAILKRGRELGFAFTAGRRPQPTPNGRIPTTMEWSRRLTATDIRMLQGQAPYTEVVPNVDEGFTRADINDPQKRDAVIKAIHARLARSRQDRPIGYLVRHAPADDVKNLRHLAGHLLEGQVITKFRKTFTRDEMNEDLHIVPARRGQHQDASEYEEMLPTSPP